MAATQDHYEVDEVADQGAVVVHETAPLSPVVAAEAEISGRPHPPGAVVSHAGDDVVDQSVVQEQVDLHLAVRVAVVFHANPDKASLIRMQAESKNSRSSFHTLMVGPGLPTLRTVMVRMLGGASGR